MSFIERHLGPRSADAEQMLETLGYSSLDALMDAVVPSQIRLDGDLQLPAPLSEHEAQAKIAGYAAKNKVLAQMIGAGYYDAVTPAVLRRNILENPGFYTSYTPYQAEISQGRLEALLNFQNTVMELTGLEIANSSLLDEASAVAEAAVMMHRANRKVKDGFFAIDSRCLPQVISVTRGRAEMLGIPFVITDFSEGLPEGDLYGIVLAYPGNEGEIRDIEPLIKAAKERNALVTVVADLLALTLLKSRVSWVLILLWVTLSVSVCPSSSAARTQRTWLFTRVWNAPCPAVWSVFLRTLPVSLRTVWLCRLVSSTSAARRLLPIFVLLRLCWRLLLALTRCTTALRGCALSRTVCTPTPLALLPL